MAASPPDAGPARRRRRYSRFVFRTPSTAVSLGLVVVLSAVLAALAFLPGSTVVRFALGWLLAFLVPGLAGALLTSPVAGALGGRFNLRRSALLAVTASALAVPLLLVARLLGLLPGVPPVATVALLLFLQGPSVWLRHMSLFGVSNPSHLRSLPATLVQPVLGVAGALLLFGVTLPLLLAAALFLLLGFAAAALLLRAADRPLRREFGISGVSLIRPLFDHINLRDPAATEALEAFFGRSAQPAHLRVTLVEFARNGSPVATVALPTVHPGPFAALGGSDLPRKLADRLPADLAGTLLVPHTPCNHDLDIPNSAGVDRVAAAARELLQGLRPSAPARTSRLVAPYEGSIARAQLLGDTALVLVSQAPEPTDDIDYPVVDQLVREAEQAGGPRLAVVDAHNSYVEDRGDVTYGTPIAERLARDVRAAVAKAVASAQGGPVDAGIAVREGYSIGEHGIGPTGIRALVLRASGATTAYVLIDGNNLLQGLRAPILDGLRGVVDDAEVMTTDNHVVHEVDGSINSVGERYPGEALAADVRATVQAATQQLGPVEIGAGTVEVPDVAVLGPDTTARLLTSLGDTFSMFSNAFGMTFFLLLATSVVVLLALP